MWTSFYFLSQGWAMSSNLPFSFKDSPDTENLTEEVLGMKAMVVPILAGIFSALGRVIARRVSLKNQLKRRLHAITITSATCFLFPVAMWDFIIGSNSGNSVKLPFSAWAFFSTIIFGVILICYVDSIAEERLRMVFSSPRHLMVAGGCIIIMEIAYKMDFSLPGFIICSLILGFGIYEATALERGKKGSIQQSDPLNGVGKSNSDVPASNLKCTRLLLQGFHMYTAVRAGFTARHSFPFLYFYLLYGSR